MPMTRAREARAPRAAQLAAARAEVEHRIRSGRRFAASFFRNSTILRPAAGMDGKVATPVLCSPFCS